MAGCGGGRSVMNEKNREKVQKMNNKIIVESINLENEYCRSTLMTLKR